LLIEKILKAQSAISGRHNVSLAGTCPDLLSEVAMLPMQSKDLLDWI